MLRHVWRNFPLSFSPVTGGGRPFFGPVLAGARSGTDGTGSTQLYSKNSFCGGGCVLSVPAVPPPEPPLLLVASLFTVNKLRPFWWLSLKPYPIATPGKPAVQCYPSVLPLRPDGEPPKWSVRAGTCQRHGWRRRFPTPACCHLAEAAVGVAFPTGSGLRATNLPSHAS